MARAVAGRADLQIREQLVVSVKSVEHHVARMRQRLGSNNRTGVFAHLRQIVGRSAES
jgi:DNA-binding CsgD family transcriptional regulator